MAGSARLTAPASIKLWLVVETLGALVRRDGPLDELNAVGWAIRLSKRVEELHKLGVAHGGLSAECVLVEAVDRGSKGVLGDVRDAATMPAYHSPERMSGSGISHADDVWAITVTLYFILTGSMPFVGETSQELRRAVTAGAPPIAVFDVGDDELQAVFDGSFNRDQARRVTRIDVFREMLERWHPDPTIRQLPPLAEGLDDLSLDYDDEDDEDDEEAIATVMRDYSDIRAELAKLGLPLSSAPDSGEIPESADSKGVNGSVSKDSNKSFTYNTLPTPRLPPRPAIPSNPIGRTTGKPISGGGRVDDLPPSKAGASALTPFDLMNEKSGTLELEDPLAGIPKLVDEETDEDDVATMLLDTSKAVNLSAAIEEALAEGRGLASPQQSEAGADPFDLGALLPPSSDQSPFGLGPTGSSPGSPQSWPQSGGWPQPVSGQSRVETRLRTTLIVACVVLAVVVVAVATLYLLRLSGSL